jgi:membrane protein DedA with SNARE-associated domain
LFDHVADEPFDIVFSGAREAGYEERDTLPIGRVVLPQRQPLTGRCRRFLHEIEMFVINHTAWEWHLSVAPQFIASLIKTGLRLGGSQIERLLDGVRPVCHNSASAYDNRAQRQNCPRPKEEVTRVEMLSHQSLEHLVATQGYLAVALIVGLESMGIPLPGETILVLAAVYAARHAELNIWLVGAAAASGAIIGDNIGYGLGRVFGYSFLRRYGHLIKLSEGRIKLGRYLFFRHGAKVVFFGRFIAFLRVFAAFLAGANGMNWKTFLAANAAGGVVWASAFASGGFILGTAIFAFQSAVRPFLFFFAALAFFGCGLALRRYEDKLQKEAELTFPGRLD